MKRPKYMLKSLGGADNDISKTDCIFFCDPKISRFNNEGYVTKAFMAITKTNIGDKSIANYNFFGDEKLYEQDFVESFTFKKYMRINMTLMFAGKIYNKNMYRHELNK